VLSHVRKYGCIPGTEYTDILLSEAMFKLWELSRVNSPHDVGVMRSQEIFGEL
jgi:hypothetical protein